MKRIVPVKWLLLSAGMLPFRSLLAQQVMHAKDTLAEVRVNAIRKLPTTSLTPAQTLSGETLQRLNSLSVADAVRFFSGIQLKDYGGVGGLKTINVRSMGSNHTGVFYDGVQLGNAQNGQIDLGRFSLDNIEEISLYSGQKDAVFQPAKAFASGNAIYLQSRKPVFAANETIHLSAKYKTGSFGLVNPSVLWQQKLSHRTSASFSGEWTNANGRYPFRYAMEGGYDTTATRYNADVNSWRLEAGLDGTGKDSSEWKVKAYYYTSARGLPGAVVANKFEHGQRLWDKSFFAQGSWKKNITGKYSLMLNAKYAYDYTHYNDQEIVTTSGYLNNYYRQNEFYFSAANHYQLTSFWDVALSGDFQRNSMNANLYNFAYPTRYTTLASLASQLHFARIDIQGSALATFVNENVRTGVPAGNRQELTPAVSASWQPFASPAFHVRAFYKNIFRMPTFNDLYYTEVGNTSLKPEFAKQYNLGITYAKYLAANKLLLTTQVDAYYNRVKDKIIASPSGRLFRWTIMNLDKVQIKGLDVSMQGVYKPAQHWELTTRASYTWQQAQDVSDPADPYYKNQIIYTPENSGSAIAGITYKTWMLNYSFLYTGGRYFQKENTAANYLQPWYTHDVSAGKSFRYKKYTGRLMLEVNNVCNQYYDVVRNFPMPGRFYRISLSVHY
ncbi:Outer membrane cobalamin receptor protein [Filimonas lacunae]|uniref:Outer membrane cobalamin receptor protein n=1 Tax=Filimonas lacunae TaxID=477680 RepID=A0A173MPC9_9BACT|nr:TonB-dependent receptor [Filimonas lacunae]BAV09494.1 outer membrane vitamin B12 receptor BtuB [Filimonas lacunae]SIS74175.1 Outer membrane cobalamin receptor protein [Filimonas lacunae]